MAASEDIIEIAILQDGTIKITTNSISGANHTNAEGLLREMAKLAGGETARVKRTDKPTHAHTHEHVHEHN